MKNTGSAWGSNKFDKKFLNTLKGDVNSGVFIQKIQHHLSLHPIHLHNLKESIKDCLNNGLAKYNKRTDGIVLGYQNVTVLSNKGLIVNDSCYIHIDLSLEFFVFKPEIGKEMRGVVNRQSKSHIGILVYGTFNVSIPKPKDDERWLGNEVSIDQEVSFKIQRINLLSHLPYIEGELVSVTSDKHNTQETKAGQGTKLVFSSESSDEAPKKKSKKEIQIDSQPSPTKKSKKRKRVSIGTEDEDPFEANEVSLESTLNNEKTPKKKRKIKEERNDESDLNVDLCDTMVDNTFQKQVKKKKSKKSRQSKEFDDDSSLSNNVKSTTSTKKFKKKKRKEDPKNEESFSDFYLTQLFEDSN